MKEYEAPLLDERKKELERVRNFKKPLNGKDLLEHEMKYRAHQSEKEQQCKKNREDEARLRRDHFSNMKWSPSLAPDPKDLASRFAA